MTKFVYGMHLESELRIQAWKTCLPCSNWEQYDHRIGKQILQNASRHQKLFSCWEYCWEYNL